MKDTLFDKFSVVTLDAASPVLTNGYVLVRDGKIAYVGVERPEVGDCDLVDGSRKALLPGFVNAHTHLAMLAFRGFGEGCDLHTWLNEYIFPAEDRWDERSIAICTNLALAESAASGITSSSDMYMFNEAVGDSFLQSGMKGNLCKALSKFAAPDGFDWQTNPSARMADDIRRHFHLADGGRIRVDAGIHAEYTSDPYLWETVRDYARQHNLNLHLHLSETRSEHEECKVRRGGLTPAGVFDKHGVFDVPTIAAHCVWADDGDIEIMARRGVTVVHNPVSNMKLASGFAPVPKMLGAGVNVALGTDGASSNNSYDFFEEIKAAAMVSKAATLDPTAVTAREALLMATRNGAAAQGRGEECGRIAVGLDADLVVVDLDKPHLYPCHDLVSNIVFAARGSDVYMNMVRGKVIYKNGEFFTIDVEKAKYEVENYVLPHIWG